MKKRSIFAMVTVISMLISVMFSMVGCGKEAAEEGSVNEAAATEEVSQEDTWLRNQ